MNLLPSSRLTERLLRRWILTSTIVPAALAAQALAAPVDWSGNVTLTINPTIVTGLREGRIEGNAFDLLTPIDLAFTGPDNGAGPGISNTIRMGQDQSNFAQATSADPDNFWNDNRTWIYVGEINSGPSGTLSFLESIDDNVQIKIDGVVVLSNQVFNQTSGTGVLTFAPNTFHEVEIRLGNGAGGAGPVAVSGFTDTYGFGFSQAGASSLNAADYIAPADPGTGTLFHHITAEAADAGNDVSILGNTTVTLTKVTNDHITENSIVVNNAATPTAITTLTVNSDVAGEGRTLRSLSTVLATVGTNAAGKTLRINGNADFAPGALSTGPTAGTATLTGVTLSKDGGTGKLILDNPTNALAGTTLKVLNGTVSVVGSGGNLNPLSTLTTPIEIGNGLSPTGGTLRLGGGNIATTFNNSVRIKSSGVIEHVSAGSDIVSGTLTVDSGKILTTSITNGALNFTGTVGGSGGAFSQGGTITKTGAGSLRLGPSSVFVTGINVNQGEMSVSGKLTTPNSPTIAPGATLSLRYGNLTDPSLIATSAGNTISIPTGTLEGVPGAFGSAATTLALTGGTLNLGLGPVAQGLSVNLYTTGWSAAQQAFGGPQFPANTYATYSNYFAGIGAGTVTTTGTGGVTELNFGGAFGDTAMYANIAPTYTRTNDIVSRFKGKIIISTPGTYTFATDADDGSMLYIDGKTVVSNNATQGHIRRTGAINLAAGLHDIDIGYYEGGGLNGIIVDYSGPDTTDVQTTIPNSVLVPVGGTGLTFPNPVVVTASSTLNTAFGASIPSLTVSAGQTVNVNGYQLNTGTLTLNGAGTYTINALTQYGEITAKGVAAGGAVVSIVKGGPGTFILDAPSSAQTMGAGSTVSVTGGALGLVLGGPNSALGNATIGSVNGHSLIVSSVGGDQTLALPAFNLGGTIEARKIGSGIAGTTGTPIRVTLNGNLALNNGTALNLGTNDNYLLSMTGNISGNATVNVNGNVATTGTNTVSGALNVNFGANLSINGGSFTGGPITVNSGTLSLGTNNALGSAGAPPTSLVVNNGTVTSLAGTYSALPAVTLNGAVIGATGPGSAPTGPTINYVLNGNVTTTPSAAPSTISAPAILLRGDPNNTGSNSPVTFTVPRGAAETDLAITSTIHDGGAGLIKNGDGILSLSAASTYSGPTVINAGTLAASGSSPLGTGTVRLNNGGTLSLVSPRSVAGFSGVSLNGGATLDATNTILTLTTDAGDQSRSAFTQTKYAVGDGFSASFVYTASGARAADGITFTVQNSAPTAVGGGGGALGYVGIPNSAALQLNIYTGAGQPIGTNLVVGTAGTYLSSAPVNLASGNPIKVELVYDSVALTVAENLLDLVTGATYSHVFNVPALSGVLGGNLGYIGFTGATGGAWAGQTVSGFRYNDEPLLPSLTIGNNIIVSAGAVVGIDVPMAGPGVSGEATITGSLTLNAGSSVEVTGGATATDMSYLVNVTGLTVLTGNSTIDVENNGTAEGVIQLGTVTGTGFSLTKTGEGTLTLSGTSVTPALNANEGTTEFITSQTLTSLNIGAAGLVVLGESTVAPAPALQLAAAAANPVPEPGSFALLLTAAFGFMSRRRR